MFATFSHYSKGRVCLQRSATIVNEGYVCNVQPL